MVDLRSFGLTGRIAEVALRDAGVTCSRNPIPADPEGAWYTSGLHLGTPATTDRSPVVENPTCGWPWLSRPA
jgi:glycine hydroxymethyltransferase